MPPLIRAKLRFIARHKAESPLFAKPMRTMADLKSLSDSDARSVCDCSQGVFDCAGLVRRHLEGDRDAGNQLVEKFGRLMQAIVTKRLRHDQRQDAEDCYQDLMLKVFGTTQDGRWRLQDWLQKSNRGPFCFWLMVVAGKHVIDWNRRPPRPLNGWEGDHADPPPPSSPPPDGAEEAVKECLAQLDAQIPELFRQAFKQWVSALARKDNLVVLEKIARELGVTEQVVSKSWRSFQRIERFRTLFRLRLKEGTPWAQVAEQMGVSERSVFNLWGELQQLLQECLRKKGFDSDD